MLQYVNHMIPIYVHICVVIHLTYMQHIEYTHSSIYASHMFLTCSLIWVHICHI